MHIGGAWLDVDVPVAALRGAWKKRAATVELVREWLLNQHYDDVLGKRFRREFLGSESGFVISLRDFDERCITSDAALAVAFERLAREDQPLVRLTLYRVFRQLEDLSLIHI